MIEKLKKISPAMKFFLAMAGIYIAAGFANPPYILSALQDILKNIVEIVPVLFLAYVSIFIINIFVKPERVKRHLGHDAGFKGWLYAIFGSILISGPPYIILPILGKLKEHGVRYSFIAVFLNNKNVQPVFLPVMIYYFGWLFSVIISIYILIFSVLTGMILERMMSGRT